MVTRAKLQIRHRPLASVPALTRFHGKAGAQAEHGARLSECRGRGGYGQRGTEIPIANKNQRAEICAAHSASADRIA